MPRRPRAASGGLVYHVLNRRVGCLPIFETDGDYAAFERTLEEVVTRSGIPLLAYCVMPNHWHLLLWPRADGELSEAMRWLTLTHTQRWHAFHGTSGTGPLYQGRFKSFPVQNDEHFLAVVRYVERNALRAKLVTRAENWRWGSLWHRHQGDAKGKALLSSWPLPRPRTWLDHVNRAETTQELEALRKAVRRGYPFGDPRWQKRTAKRLSLESTLRPRGRPRKQQ